MPDINMTCIECEKPFFFAEKDQAYYKSVGYTPPKRCYGCRQRRKNSRVPFTAEVEAEYSSPPAEYGNTWNQPSGNKRK